MNWTYELVMVRFHVVLVRFFGFLNIGNWLRLHHFWTKNWTESDF